MPDDRRSAAPGTAHADSGRIALRSEKTSAGQVIRDDMLVAGAAVILMAAVIVMLMFAGQPRPSRLQPVEAPSQNTSLSVPWV